MRIVIVISSLGTGGAERFVSIMANYWVAKGWQVSVLSMDNGKEPPWYRLDPKVEHLALGIAGDSLNWWHALANNSRRLRVLRRVILAQHPQSVISLVDRTNVLTVIALLGTGIPVIVSERTDPAQYAVGRVWDWARRLAYRHASVVVCQTKAAAGYFRGEIQRRTVVIPGLVLAPAEPAPTEMRSDRAPREHAIVAMGRLAYEKGFDLLLSAWTGIATQYPKWRLDIWGEGTERAALEQVVHQNRLQARVRLPGRTTSPAAVLKDAGLFVLSSRFEGFPNVLLEAMACGLPVISFDCPSGPREIIRNGVDGVLVPPGDVVALSAAMARLLGDDKERRRLGQNAIEVTQRFNVERVMGMWEALLPESRSTPP